MMSQAEKLKRGQLVFALGVILLVLSSFGAFFGWWTPPHRGWPLVVVGGVVAVCGLWMSFRACRE